MRLRRQGLSHVVDTPAKLNLSLEILGRRPDGYHEIETVMVSIGLYDSLRFTPTADGSFSLATRLAVRPLPGEPPPVLDCGDDNLVLKAARLLQSETGVRMGATIELVKRIPWQAGLGGGSSDAAATLAALNRAWNLNLPSEELHRLAARLGSDVNFFLDSCPAAICRGRGEQIEPVPLRRALQFLVVQPVGGLSTGEVFRAWRSGESTGRSAAVVAALARGGPHSFSNDLYNSLEAPAVALHEGVARLLKVLRKSGGLGASLSGSGSACFLLCRSRREAIGLGHRLGTAERCRACIVTSRT